MGEKNVENFTKFIKRVILTWVCGSAIGFAITSFWLGKEVLLSPSIESISSYCITAIVYIAFSIILWAAKKRNNEK